MADYSKLKVQELKDELKSRGIPLTGLRVKQQFIDKLVEHDAEGENNTKEVAEDVTEADNPAETAPKQHDQEDVAVPAPVPVAPDASMPDAGPAEPVQEHAKEESNSQGHSVTGSGSPAPTTSTEPPLQTRPEPPQAPSKTTPDTIETPVVTESAEREIVEDQKKRKRRSVTPVPHSGEVSVKKARALDGSPRPTKVDGSVQSEELEARLQVASNEIDRPTDMHINGSAEEKTGEVVDGDIRMTEPKDHHAAPNLKEDGRSSIAEAENDASQRMDLARRSSESTIKPPAARGQYKSLVAQDARSASPTAENQDEDRQVVPALHPATRSLYIRNLKRPLQVGVLRNHLEKLGTPSGASPDSNIITELFLDSIKSHAFASFSSIAVASRVRSRLHDVRWPEEAMRDALWVDFIPDDKVKEWVEIENPSAGGGRGISRRWEVVYDESADGGREAKLREVGARPPPPPIASKRDQMPVSREDIGPPTSKIPSALPPGIHPDRAGLVPQDVPRRHESSDYGYDRRRPSPTTARGDPAPTSGTGFRALDDLFPSTVAKPKLYYKPVSEDLAEARKDAFRDLFKVGRIEPGEEMKRYSFEEGDRWVDKGPEFGYGRSRGRGGGGGGGGLRSRGGARFGGPRVGGREDTFPRGDRYGGRR